MKKFTKIIICLLLCVVSLCFVACDDRTPEQKNFTYPSASDITYGNGGMAVQKGNYIYCVNGFKNVSEAKQHASYTLGSLIMLKLDENGNIVKDENNLLKDDFYITMSDKLTGFEATNLFIGGDYLYFTSPSQDEIVDEEDKTNTIWQKDRVEFLRIRLDAKGGVEEVYESAVTYSNLQFEYYYENSNTYILVMEKGANLDDSSISDALIRVDCNAKSSSRVATGVSSVVMPKEADKIFYVKSAKVNNITNYCLDQYNIATNDVDNFETRTSNFKVEAVTGDKQVGNYTVFISAEENSSTLLYSADIATKSAFGSRSLLTGLQSYNSYKISPDGSYLIGTKANKIKIVKLDGSRDETPIQEDEEIEKLTLVGFLNGSVVYVDDLNNIKVVSYSGDNQTIRTIAKVEDMDTTYFDLEETYMYFYKTVGSNKYLHRVELSNTYEEGETAEEMVGVYLADDIPTEEEIEE